MTAIDTDAGKTVAVGLLGRFLAGRGLSVATAKLVQTGASELSPDIAVHRQLLGAKAAPSDDLEQSCLYLLPYPASPHLAAALAGVEIDGARLAKAFNNLASRHDELLIEGVGGFLAPLTRSLTSGDFVAGQKWPVIIVTSPRLGSINHTLLTLEAVAARGLEIAGLVYNLYDETDPEITADTRRLFLERLAALGRKGRLVDLPAVSDFGAPPLVDFSAFFGPGDG